MAILFKYAVLGGTFDRLHAGHQKLIDTAFEQSEKVIIGLTQPTMYAHKLLAKTIEDYETREKNLKTYLAEKKYESYATIIPITDIYGTTLEDKQLEAIFATEENLKNVESINLKRKEIGFPELKVIIVPYVNDKNGEHITSERIRKGEIDKDGAVYKNLFQQNITLSDTLREQLRNPLGEVVKDTDTLLHTFDEQTIVIAVGDIITTSLVEKNKMPALSIIDLRTRREAIQGAEKPNEEKVHNEKGTINNEAVTTLQDKLDSYLKTGVSQTLLIDGEEDLLALPAILLAPLNSVVLYGQFDQGVVVNKVTANLKQKIVKILEKI